MTNNIAGLASRKRIIVVQGQRANGVPRRKSSFVPHRDRHKYIPISSV